VDKLLQKQIIENSRNLLHALKIVAAAQVEHKML
jgi:hypothetical protein